MSKDDEYDDLCRVVRKATHAKAVVLLIVDGYKGTSGSCSLDRAMSGRVAGLLRETADRLITESGMASQHEGN